MRLEKAADILRLAIRLRASHTGLTMKEIQDEFDWKPRTALRMRQAVEVLFGELQQSGTDTAAYRWRLPPGTIEILLDISADELAALESAQAQLRAANLADQASRLSDLQQKVQALMKPAAQVRSGPDLEALLEAEGLACRPGPRPRIMDTVIEAVRTAIKAGTKVRIMYQSERETEPGWRLVHPYGLLYGHRHYLVAHDETRPAPEPKLFTLARITEVDPGCDMFERPADFSIKTFAARSFGLWREDPSEVVLRFTPEAAPRARDFLFHPEQTMDNAADGSLVVRFTAGGKLEMAWYLYAWGTHVEVLAPQELADLVHPNRTPWPGMP